MAQQHVGPQSDASSDFYDSPAPPPPDPHQPTRTSQDAQDNQSPYYDLPEVGSPDYHHFSRSSKDSDVLSAGQSLAGKKRRLDSPAEEDSATIKRHRPTVFPHENIFAASIPQESGRPVEVWQHVFSYLPPNDLCKLLRVSRTFNLYLTQMESKQSATPLPKHSSLKVQDSEKIWSVSRRIHAPLLPRPLDGFTERSMLAFLAGPTCQVCNVLKSRANAPADAYTAGPGHDSICIVWQFSARLCGTCFEHYVIKDTDLLQSVNGKLASGLPFAFRSRTNHYIRPAQVHKNTPIPINKVYFVPNIKELAAAYQEAQTFGPAATEEWLKGLPGHFRSKDADAKRWLQWEINFPLGADFAQVLREMFHVKGVRRPSTSLPVPQALTHPLPKPVFAPLSSTAPTKSKPAFAPLSSTASTKSHPQVSFSAEEYVQRRKIQVQRRALEEFSPPLQPEVLEYIPSYHDLVKTFPNDLTEEEWQSFQPVIDQQRDQAELKHYERENMLRILQAGAEPQPVQTQQRGGVEDFGEVWAYKQQALREEVGFYADTIIAEHWNDGRVDFEKLPNFAADVLIGVKAKFDGNHDSRGASDTNGIENVYLTLDTMKWVFEEKIQRYTKPRKDLFRCDECRDRLMAFEGLIQHFGAKHTSDFSRDNVVVHWQTAAWPDDPPFMQIPVEIREPRHVPDRKKSHLDHGKTSAPSRNGSGHGHGARETAVTPSQMLTAPSADLSQIDLSAAVQELLLHQQSLAAHAPTQPSLSQLLSGFQQPASEVAQSSSSAVPSMYAATQQVPTFPEAELSHVRESAQRIWDLLIDVRGLEIGIVMLTVLHHASSNFRSHFARPPSFELVIQAMKDIRIDRVRGLACKACVANVRSERGMPPKPYRERMKHSNAYDLADLVAHYTSTHTYKSSEARLTWKENLIIESPREEEIPELLNLPGMTDVKIATIGTAFPIAFSLMGRGYGTVASATQGTTEKDRQADDDEYDPRRPAVVADAAQFQPYGYEAPSTLRSASSQYARPMVDPQYIDSRVPHQHLPFGYNHAYYPQQYAPEYQQQHYPPSRDRSQTTYVDEYGRPVQMASHVDSYGRPPGSVYMPPPQQAGPHARHPGQDQTMFIYDDGSFARPRG